MLTNYLRIALRNLLRHKAFSFINLIGLAIGLTCCLLIARYVQHELSYDNFHAKADRIVRVTMEYGGNGQSGKVAVTGTKVAPAFGRAFPEVENGVRMIRRSVVVRYGEKLFEEPNFYYADSAFFPIFSFQLLEGNSATALKAPNQVVLTANTARKYFGSETPVGKTLRIGDTKDYLVTGVAADVPTNSQIRFDFVASFSSLDASKTEEWWSANYITYLLLRNKEAIAPLQTKIPGYMRIQSKELGITGSDYLTYHLEPLRSVHLGSELSGFEPNNNMKYIYIFSAVALLILVIACVNYTNLTTARATDRAKEVGMRKVMGAVRGQLFWQFMGESVIVTGIALVLSLGLMYLMLPAFNELAGKKLAFTVFGDASFLAGLIVIGLVVSLFAGSYPALALANFQPIKVLKGSFKTSGSGIWLRKSLMVFQFVISTFLIISTLIIRQQLQFIQNTQLGYDKDHVVVLPADSKIVNNFSAIKSELKRHANVREVTMAYETPTQIDGGYSIHREGAPDDQNEMVKAIPVEQDFIKTMGMQLVAGTDLTEEDVKRTDKPEAEAEYAFILNEAAAKKLGWKPEEAIGQKVSMSGRRGPVKAVVKDFHFASLHEAIGPLVIFPEKLYGGNMMVKLSGNDLPSTLRFMESKWKTLAPHRPFEYQFLDEEFADMYSTEQRVGQLFSTFAFLAIFLACLGLFGLAAFTTVQRTKEIGIRKVLGATVTSIVALLSKDFLQLVLLANVLAWPLAWYAMHRWLEDFVYRINIGWWIFGIAALAVLLITLLTVSYQAIKAALANPVKSLRTE